MKKILAMLMTALLAVSTFATPVFAEDYWSADQIKAELTLGVEYHNHRDEGKDDSDRFLFVAPQDGTYRFHSTDSSEEDGRDADGAVYTEYGYDMPALAEDRDENILGFDMTCKLEEGQRVFFEHVMWGKDANGEWDYGTDGSFIIELIQDEPIDPPDDPDDPDPEECTHSYAEEVAATSATCCEEGNIGYVYCPECGKYFDAETWLDNPDDPVFVEISPESVITPIDPTYHSWSKWTVTKEPTVSAYGEKTRVCYYNQEHKETQKIAKLKDVAKATVGGVKTSYSYTGKAIKPTVTVKYDATTLKSGTDYKVSYSANTKVGTAKIKITGLGKYGGTLTKTFKIVKAKQPMTVKAKTVTVKYSAVKKKAQTVKVGTALTIAKAQGTKSYAITSKGKLSGVKINKKTGAITIPKGTKKGTYKIKVKVTAKGNASYKAGSKTVTVKIVVK